MMIIAYLYGISSDGYLCNQIHFNLTDRWFCKLNLTDKAPHHSSLTRIRDRLGIDVFKEIFLNITLQCKKAGLIIGNKVMTDSTLFQANASLDSMVPRDRRINDSSLKGNEVVPGISPPQGKA